MPTWLGVVIVVIAVWAYFEIRTLLNLLADGLTKITELIQTQREEQEDPDEMSFDEKLDCLKNEVHAYLRAEDPEEWEQRNRWSWSDWEVRGWRVAELDRELREKSPNLDDLPKEMQDDLQKKRDAVREKQKIIEEQRSPEERQRMAEQPKYIAEWIEHQPEAMLRQQCADGLLSDGDAEDLIAAEALQSLGPSYEYRLCYISSRDRVFGRAHHDCYEWETHHLPPDVYPAWHALKTRLPEGAEWKFCEVFPCLLNGREKPADARDGVGKRVYVAKVKVPVGPFRFERNILLSPAEPR